ncbi:5-aminolevulinate synthase [Celeribacter sp. PS-C1]|uniref:5-aminolevulinate synthase n=1 Tax=Celeribacter sp. PS-C1 TaxID=2820813 RepID=UPI001CA4E926|nr:5-aminolevulinate synthase [Celeribacter sp. PS-C1]MBW6418646.1 5-aminolevulinate synthase [Celeribacter sp. PS-C1]
MYALPSHHLVFLVLVGAGYALATVGMKLVASSGAMPSSFGLCLIVAGLLAAIIFEIILLRQAPVSQLYLIVIAVETAIVLSFACLIGEQITPRLALGMGFIFVGLATVAH